MCKKVSPLSPLLRFHSGFENPQQKRCLFSGLYLTPPPPQGLEVTGIFLKIKHALFLLLNYLKIIREKNHVHMCVFQINTMIL